MSLWVLGLPAGPLLAAGGLDVLVLDDGGEGTADLVALLEGQGHSVTCSCDDGLLESDFDGTPYLLADHQVVFWLDGGLARAGQEMPPAGQLDLVAWVESGGGLVHYGATTARYVDDGENADALELMLLTGSELSIGSADFEVLDGGHPATAAYGTGDTFQVLGVGMVASATAVGTTLLEWSPSAAPEGPYQGLVVSDLGSGRIAQFGWVGHVGSGWSSNLDYSNVDVAALLPNTVQHVARRPPDVDAGGPYEVDPGDFTLISGTAEDPDGGELSCSWDLDDDGLIDTTDLLTTWDASATDGPQTVSLLLTCEDDEGDTASDTASLYVPNLPPTIEAIDVPSPADEGTPLGLSVTYSDPEPADTHTVAWELGDGASLTGAEIVHTYAADGTYTVEVVVTDDDGDSDARSFVWTVHNLAPSVVLQGDQTGEVGQELAFSCSAQDAGGDPLALSWDLGDGTTAGDVAELVHAYQAADVYTVRCTADDGSESATVSLEVVISRPVSNTAPDTPALLSPANGDVLGRQVSLRIAPVADPDGPAPTLELRVDESALDRAVVSLTDLAQGITETAVALPELPPGSYRWQVRAVDGLGLAGPWSPAWYFAVEDPPETAEGPWGCACRVLPGTAGSGPGLWLGLVLAGLVLSRRSVAARWARATPRGP